MLRLYDLYLNGSLGLKSTHFRRKLLKLYYKDFNLSFNKKLQIKVESFSLKRLRIATHVRTDFN